MRRRQRRILAVAALLGVAALAGPPTASAGFAIYQWGGLAGSGSYFDTNTGQFRQFTTNDGELTVGYDPDRLDDSYIDVDTGSPGYEVRTIALFTISATATEVTLTATYGSGGDVRVLIDGACGAMDPVGDPASLNSLLGAPADVTVTPGYHVGFSFAGAAVPEPSSLTILAIGGVGILVACAVRPARPRGRRRL